MSNKAYMEYTAELAKKIGSNKYAGMTTEHLEWCGEFDLACGRILHDKKRIAEAKLVLLCVEKIKGARRDEQCDLNG